MLRGAEEHAPRNTLPADAAVSHHEAEVKKRGRQKEHDGRADTGIVLLPPKSDADMEDSVTVRRAKDSWRWIPHSAAVDQPTRAKKSGTHHE